MYTRYKGISIPENYSGTRFVQENPLSYPNDTNINKGVSESVKTSVSPKYKEEIERRLHSSFEEAENNQAEEENKEEWSVSYEKSDTDEGIYDKNREGGENEATPANSIQDEASSKEPQRQAIKEIGASLSKLFSPKQSDDFLLLMLCLLIFNENAEGSVDILVILMLLLLYH